MQAYGATEMWEAEHAANAIVRLAHAHAGELLLIALGPLTNIALALRLEPRLPQLVKGFVFMGGTSRGSGNVTPVVSEFLSKIMKFPLQMMDVLNFK